MRANVRLRDGSTVADRRFDRLKSFDEKSKLFPARTLMSPTQFAKPRSYTWSINLMLDQGQEGACVSCGWGYELAARPSVVSGVHMDWCRNFIYYPAQRIDEWAGENYDGTSVLAGAKIVKAMGFITEYRWCFSLEDVIAVLGYKGPVVIGVNWYTGMFDTNAKGFIRPTGSILGGHCVAINKINVREGWVSGPNSWGRDWGINGYWKMSLEDFDRLRREDGEVCVPLFRSGTSDVSKAVALAA